jgi:predicted RNA-binding protein YlxR (DUF448 family)
MLARLQQSEMDSGPRGRAEPERLCVATRTVKPVAEMIRFVVAPDGTVVPDLKSRLPGRGIWITATRAAVAQAVRRKAIAAALKRKVSVDTGLAALTEQMLERAALDALAICGKAGLVVTGFAKVEAALVRAPVMVLLHAADAAADGVRKLDAALQRRTASDGERRQIVTELSSAQLDLALARPNVIHAALLAGSASATFLVRYARLTRFRTGTAAGSGTGIECGSTGKVEE